MMMIWKIGSIGKHNTWSITKGGIGFEFDGPTPMVDTILFFPLPRTTTSTLSLKASM